MEKPSGEAEAWRSAAEHALQAHDELLDAWRRQKASVVLPHATSEDVELLRQLIVRKIYPVNAFEVLARIDHSAAIEVLLARYLGDGVDPDTKFGGFTFELSSMLDDLKEAHGQSALRSLIENPRFRRDLLMDPRVIEAFTNALDMSPDEFPHWAAQQ